MIEVSDQRPIFLWGMMGTGKSSVGRILAERLGRQFIDLDEAIATRENSDIEALFIQRGESVFRQLEKEAFTQQLQDGKNKVIALGGGTLLDDKLREEARKTGPVICLGASIDTLLARLEGSSGRPLLDKNNLRLSLVELQTVRSASYADSDAHIDTDQQSIEAVVAGLCDMLVGAEGSQ
ncbi:MAG: shikimate kinase [Myxococcota bacterium]|nr:shikimate kinase [Myxococcota bacterium]